MVREALSSSSRTPLQDLMGMITPSDLHFERHHGGVPSIVSEEHELLVHGMVDRPMTFRMADLMRYPQVSRIQFLECSGNGG
jgi:sulfane dehydrogenase subunit SoxC